MTDRKDGRSGVVATAPPEDEAFDAQLLERAQAALDRLRDFYLTDWAPAAVDELYCALAEVAGARGDRAESFREMFRIAHDMKGQGETFGYPLLSEIGGSLCHFTQDRRNASGGEMVVLRAHADAARRVLELRLAGDGGLAGRRIMRDLRAVALSHMH